MLMWEELCQIACNMVDNDDDIIWKYVLYCDPNSAPPPPTPGAVQFIYPLGFAPRCFIPLVSRSRRCKHKADVSKFCWLAPMVFFPSTLEGFSTLNPRVSCG